MGKQSRLGSRRGFLKGMAGAAAVASAAPWYAMGDEPAKPQPAATAKPKGVGDGLRVGLIGCGGQGSGDAKNAQRLDARIAAVCDVDEGHLATAKKTWPEAQTFSDFRKLLETKELDA